MTANKPKSAEEAQERCERHLPETIKMKVGGEEAMIRLKPPGIVKIMHLAATRPDSMDEEILGEEFSEEQWEWVYRWARYFTGLSESEIGELPVAIVTGIISASSNVMADRPPQQGSNQANAYRLDANDPFDALDLDNQGAVDLGDMR